MKYVVFRVSTNAQGNVVTNTVGSYDDRLAAESHFHEEAADAASKVLGSGRLCDGAYLLTSDGKFLDSKFYTPTNA